MVMKFLHKWFGETVDDFMYATRKVGESIGVQQKIDNTIYELEDLFFYDLFRKLYDYQVINTEIIPVTGPAIIVSNHLSELDPIVIGLAITHTSKRKPYQLGKAELMTVPFYHIFTRLNKSIFIRRGESDETAMNECKKLLKQGNLLVIYPEGTIGTGNGKFLEFKNGAVRLAYLTQVPIIPVAIYGMDRIFGKGAKIPQTKGKMRVKYGTPLSVEKLFKNVTKNYNEDGSLKELDIKEYTNITKKIKREVEKLWMDLWMQEEEKKKHSQEKDKLNNNQTTTDNSKEIKSNIADHNDTLLLGD